MKKIILYISITVATYAVCFSIDGKYTAYSPNVVSYQSYQTQFEYKHFYRKEYQYKVDDPGNKKYLIKESLFIDWDAVANIPYICLVLIIIEVLRIKRKNDHKPLPFLRKKKSKKEDKEEERTKEMDLIKNPPSSDF